MKTKAARARAIRRDIADARVECERLSDIVKEMRDNMTVKFRRRRVDGKVEFALYQSDSRLSSWQSVPDLPDE